MNARVVSPVSLYIFEPLAAILLITSMSFPSFAWQAQCAVESSGGHATFAADQPEGVRNSYETKLGITFRNGDGGIVAEEVPMESAAYLAGLRAGDQVTAIDGRQVASVDDALHALSLHQSPQPMRLTVIPTSAARNLELAAPPAEDSSSTPMLGVILEDRSGAVVVSELYVGGPAESAGVRSGDRIMEIGGKPVNATAQVLQALIQHRAGDQVNLLVARDQWQRHMPVTLASRQYVASLPRTSVPSTTTYRTAAYRAYQYNGGPAANSASVQRTRPRLPGRYGDVEYVDGGSAANIYDVNRRALYTSFD